MKKAYFQYIIEDLKEKELLQATIMGHLVIEYMIDKALEVNECSIRKIEKMNFPQKIDSAIKLNIILPNQESLYLSINRLRNRFAHELDFEPTFEEIHNLVIETINAGIDFTDDSIKNPTIAKQLYGDLGCLWEVLNNTSEYIWLYLDSKGIQLPL